jgi:hypothetical protein
MEVQTILRYRFYLVMALVYVISVTALCFKAPVVQRRMELTSADVETEPNQSAEPYAAIGTPIAQSRTQSATMRAPLWALGSQFSLNASLFAEEQGELIGLALFVAVAYRLRTRLVIWGVTVSAFVGSRRRGTCIWLGFLVVLLLTLFPPWVQIKTFSGRFPTQHVKLWHAPIFRAPVETTRWQSSEVDYGRMLMEIATGECFVLALYLTWARTKPTVTLKG